MFKGLIKLVLVSNYSLTALLYDMARAHGSLGVAARNGCDREVTEVEYL